MRRLTILFSSFLLALGLACGGGSSQHDSATPSPKAGGLAYTDPTSTGWRLVKDPASTPSRLLLNLVGPAGLKTRGAGFNLRAAGAVRFGHFAETGFPVKDLGVYELLNTDPRDPFTGDPLPPDPLEPKLLAGGVKAGNLLTVGVFQKDRRATAKDSGHPLFQIAVEFDATAHLLSGDALSLAVVKARHQGEDVGAFSVNPTREMARKAVLVDMGVAVGTLRAN